MYSRLERENLPQILGRGDRAGGHIICCMSNREMVMATSTSIECKPLFSITIWHHSHNLWHRREVSDTAVTQYATAGYLTFHTSVQFPSKTSAETVLFHVLYPCQKSRLASVSCDNQNLHFFCLFCSCCSSFFFLFLKIFFSSFFTS